jgi:hypothetical protein
MKNMTDKTSFIKAHRLQSLKEIRQEVYKWGLDFEGAQGDLNTILQLHLKAIYTLLSTDTYRKLVEEI